MLGRLIAVVLINPFLLAPVTAALLWQTVSTGVILAIVCLQFAFSWLAAAGIAASGRVGIAGGVWLFASAAVVAAMIVLAGGMASPLALLLLAIPAETRWIGGWRPGLPGMTACLLAAFATVVGSVWLPEQLSQASLSAWQWIVPLLWLASFSLRFRQPEVAKRPTPQREPEPTVLEDMMDAVTLRIDGEGKVAKVSGQWDRLFGLQPEQLTGHGFRDRIHVADKVAYLAALADIRDGGGSARQPIRLSLPAPDGGTVREGFRPFSVEILASGRHADDLVVVARDDSAHWELQQELAAIGEANDKHDISMRRFLSTVSHELRTPLNSIIGFSDMLRHEVYGGLENPRQRECVELIAQSGEHLLSVVNSILDVSKIESGNYFISPEPFVFRDAVATCFSMMSPQAERKNLILDERIGDEIGEIEADRRAIQQVLINLISNAIKFTPEGGAVTVDARRLDGFVQFQVSDTGIGIAAEDLEMIGRPFTQIQNDYTRQFEGTGLGLSVVKGLVALHGGELAIESAPEMGTTVTVRLPHNPALETTEDPLELKYRSEKEEPDETFRKTA